MVTQDLFYIDLTKKEKELALGFLIMGLLRSRGEANFMSNSQGYDEDVNVYLAHLMLSLLDSRNAERVGKYVLKRDQDVFKLIEGTDDIALKHLVYRANADHLLVHIGLFDNLGTSFKEQRSFYGKPKSAYMGRGKIYYQFAASYGREGGKRISGLSEVLMKLSQGFEKYAAILSAMSGEYMDFVEKKVPDKFERFQDQIKHFEHELAVREKTDAFLDLYLEWRKTQNPELRTQLKQMVEEIRKIQPDFNSPIF